MFSCGPFLYFPVNISCPQWTRVLLNGQDWPKIGICQFLVSKSCFSLAFKRIILFSHRVTSIKISLLDLPFINYSSLRNWPLVAPMTTGLWHRLYLGLPFQFGLINCGHHSGGWGRGLGGRTPLENKLILLIWKGNMLKDPFPFSCIEIEKNTGDMRVAWWPSWWVEKTS